MIRVVALLHPFKSNRIIKEVKVKSLRQIYEDLEPVLPIEHARIMIDDKPVSDFDIIPMDGQSIIIRVVPGNNQESGKTSLAGFGLIILGGALTVLSGGLLSTVGIGLMIAGAGMFVGGIAVLGANYLLGQLGESGTHNSDQLPQIRGARNKANPWGSIPIVLGKHLVVPPYASTPYTEIVGNNQYLRQLFCVGYSEIELTNFKIGDTALSEFLGVTTEVLQDGSCSTIIPKQVVESNIGQELKYNIPMIRTAAGKCTKISIDLIFPSGLVKYNDDGDKKNTSVSITTHYKLTGTGDENYVALSTITQWTDKTSTSKRITLSKVVAEGQYDVKLTRTTVNATKHTIVNKSYWGALRAKRDIDSVSASMRAKVCTVGLKIKATDQLSGVVDQFNCIAQSKVSVYSGSGSGAAQWTINTLTNNPAALFLWVLRGTPNPRPVDDTSIDWTSLETWYTWCVSSGHECNAVVTAVMPLKEILQKICSTGRASFTKIDGKYTIIQDIAQSTPIQHFTSRNSWAFVGSKEFPDMPHALKMSFVNDESGYSPDERIVYDDGYDEGTATKFQSIKIWGITDPDQIWKDARYQIACARLRPEIFTLNCDIEHLVCTRGDLIRITHDVPLFGIQAGRIKSLTADGNNDIIEIDVDETFIMELGKTYGVRIRKSNGASIYRDITTVEGDNKNIILSSVIPAGDSPLTGDLVMFGEASQESVEMIVIAVEPQKDLTARITLIEYNSACYTADSGTIPSYESKITIPGDWQDSSLIHEIYNPESVINDNVNDNAENSGSTPSYTDIDEGYNSTSASGGTTTPTIPVLLCDSAYKSIILRLDKQTNLRWLKEYQLQVSSDGSNWYSLRLDGIDWKGTLGAITFWPAEMLVHSRIPSDLTNPEDPQPRSLFYRVRRVTVQSVASGWSDTVTGVTSLLETGDIPANTITANMVNTAFLQAVFVNISGDLVIGFSGTGIPSSPNEGDSRYYINGIKSAIEEFTGGNWSAVNGIKMGGLDSNGLLSPFITCRGVINPLADEVNQEFFPESNFKILTFETNFSDQNGNLPNFTTSAVRTTDWSKFGTYSFGSTPTNRGLLQYDDVLTLTDSIGFLSWMKWVTIGSGEPLILTALYKIAPTTYYAIYVSYDSSSEKFKMRFEENNNGSFNNNITITISMAKTELLTGTHTLGYVFSQSDSKIYLIVDDTVEEGAITPLVIAGASTTDNYMRFLTEQNYSSNGIVNYQDEIVYAADNEVDPDIFIQHYNHNVPWNTDASVKDIVLKPAPGGKVRAIGGLVNDTVVVTGPVGPQGSQGSQGEQGLQGDQGDIGNPGSNATSWNDIDAFSSGDIAGFAGVLYISLQNNNTNNQPDISSDWWVNYTNALSNNAPSFIAHYASGVAYSNPGVIPFNMTTQNQNNCFSIVSHAFTVPVGYAGNYFFAFGTMNNSTVNSAYQFTVNGVDLKVKYTSELTALGSGVVSYSLSNYTTNYSNAPMFTIRELEVGDVVQISLQHGQMHPHTSNQFTGFYLGGAKGSKGDAGIGNGWNPLTIYSSDAVVSFGDTIYKSLEPGNKEHFPDEIDSLWWTLAYVTNSSSYKIMHLQHRLAPSIASGQVSAGWNTCPTNHEAYNTIIGASLNTATYEFTLPAGLYEFYGMRNVFYVHNSASKLTNVTNGTTQLVGQKGYAGQGTGYNNDNVVTTGIIDIQIQSTFKLELYAETARATDGWGYTTNSFGGEDSVWEDIIITDLNSLKGEQGDTGPGFAGWNDTTNYGLNSIVADEGIGYISTQTGNRDKKPIDNTFWWKPAIEPASVTLLPVGSTYVQYPNKQDPSGLGYYGTWSNISSEFPGYFFRAEGGRASAFESGIQIHQFEDHAHAHNHYFRFGGGGAYGPASHGTSDIGYGYTNTNAALPSSGSRGEETRPSNHTIRIWERIS